MLDALRDSMLIRCEETGDQTEVYALNCSAFETPAEAKLVEALRESVCPVISLVAVHDEAVVGHIMFSPVHLPEHPGAKIMGLAPMAVAPDCQKEGIGGVLVQAGLKRCRELGIGAVVVLGHVNYYPRFGFSSSSHYGIGCEYDAPEGAFMALELEPDYLQSMSGTIQYHSAFSGV